MVLFITQLCTGEFTGEICSVIFSCLDVVYTGRDKENIPNPFVYCRKFVASHPLDGISDYKGFYLLLSHHIAPLTSDVVLGVVMFGVNSLSAL